MFRLFRRMPFLKLLALAKLAMLARRHMQRLDASDRRRLGELVRRGRGMDSADREELRRLLGKVEPWAFAASTADLFSPVRIPRRFRGGAPH